METWIKNQLQQCQYQSFTFGLKGYTGYFKRLRKEFSYELIFSIFFYLFILILKISLNCLRIEIVFLSS